MPPTLVRARSGKVGYEISFTRHFYKPQPCAHWRRSGMISWRWSGKRRGCCWGTLSGSSMLLLADSRTVRRITESDDRAIW